MWLPTSQSDDYCFNNQSNLPHPFNEENLWTDLPGFLGLDREKNMNSVVYEPTELTLHQLLSLEPNKGLQSFVMTEVLDSYLHLLELYCEDIAFVPSYAIQIFKAERSLDNITHFNWKDRKLRYIFMPVSLVCDAHTAIFLFYLRGSLLTLLDSDSRRRQDDRAILITEGKVNTDPVLEEIIGLFTILLYYLSPLLFTVLQSYF